MKKLRGLICYLFLVLSSCSAIAASESTPTTRLLLTSIDYHDIGILFLGGV